jgi:hypothetical protein
MTPIGSRRIHDVWPAMYSPADRPSSTRAAPAKNRIWSTIGRDLLRRRDGVRLARVLPLEPDEVVGPGLDGVRELEQRPLPLSPGVESRQVSNARDAAS